MMKAITLTQPWATLMSAGEKRIETRSWSPRGLHMGERVAIHAGRGLGDMSVMEFCRLCKQEPFRSALVRARDKGVITTRKPGELYPGDLPRGCVVAVAEFFTAFRTESGNCDKAVVQSITKGATFERDFGNYSNGRWGWIFVRIRPLAEPIPARGALSLWTWDAPAHLAFAESERPA